MKAYKNKNKKIKTCKNENKDKKQSHTDHSLF